MVELGYNFLSRFKQHHFLYLFGFLINFKPIDPFLYEMIVTSKNITEQEYKEQIHPISAYTSVIISLLIFLFISFCVFNYFLSFACFAGLIFSIAQWQGVTVREMQIAQGSYGFVTAIQIIYYSSIYVCPHVKKDFGPLTSYIRGIPLVANLLGAIISQIVVTNVWLNFKELAFLNVPAFAHALLLVFHLPRLSELGKPPDTFFGKVSQFKKKTKDTFLIPHVLKWSLWSAFTICGYMQVSFCMQFMWRQAQLQNGENPYNGAVEAISVFLSLLAVLISGTLKSHSMKQENLFLLVTSLLLSALMFGYATVDNAWDCTIFYIIFNIIYHFVITTVSAMIAKSVYRNGSFGLVFSFISFIYLVLNLTFVYVFNVSELNFTTHDQFLIYGGYHLGIAVLIIVFWLLKV